MRGSERKQSDPDNLVFKNGMLPCIHSTHPTYDVQLLELSLFRGDQCNGFLNNS